MKMDDSLQDNINYIFDYQTKLSYNLPLNTVALFELDLSNSLLNNSSIQAINNVQDVLTKGFRKLYVNITWDNQENNWILCQTNIDYGKNKSIPNTNSYSNNNNNNNNNKYTIVNLIKSIRKWIDNSNDCSVIIVIFKINSFESIDREQSISCINGYSEKLEILKRDIMSEVKDIIYTVSMMKEGIYHEKKYQEKVHRGISYTNGNWTSFKKLCSMNKKMLIGLESNNFLCKDYKDNILFTNNDLIKKLISYQDLKKYVLFSSPNTFLQPNNIKKFIKLIDKQNNSLSSTYDQDIDINKNLSVVFTPEDTINIKKEVMDLINNYNMNIHMKTFDLNSIQSLKSSLLWSWDINTDFIDNSSNSCIAVSKTTGRWIYHSCEDNFPIACKNRNDPLNWLVTLDKCDDGYILSLPHSFQENHMLWQTLQNKTLSSYDYFFLSKIPIDSNNDIISEKRELLNLTTTHNEKYVTIPTTLNYSELIEEIYKTSFSPGLMVLMIILFLIARSIRKQYVIFKKRRRRQDIKKRLKVAEIHTVPI